MSKEELNYVMIGEYGLGEVSSPPEIEDVYFIDVDEKTITKIQAVVSYVDSYIFETIDIGECNMIVTDVSVAQHLIDDEGYTLS